MKIISIEIINEKAIEVFSKQLDGNNLVVAGDPNTGKTTAISALWDIIEKKGEVLSHGATKGYIKVKLSDGTRSMVCKRSMTEKTNTITITDNEGDTVSIKDFKQMISPLSVNPHKIMDLKPQEQVKALLASVDTPGFDYDETEKNLAALTDERLELFRTKKQYVVPDIPVEKVDPVNTVALVHDLKEVNEFNAVLVRGFASLVTSKLDVKKTTERITNLQQELQDMLDLKDIQVEKVRKTELYLLGHPEKPTASIEESIAAADDTNKKAREYEAYKKLIADYTAADIAWSTKDEEVKEVEAFKKKTLDEATFPIPDLLIKDGAVYYEDCLISNLGESKQMLVSAALASKSIKDIKVVRIDGIESMSKQDFDLLVHMFNDADIQVLATRVSRGDIDDGEIVITEGIYKDKV